MRCRYTYPFRLFSTISPAERVPVWENQESIDRYRKSDAREEIKRHGAKLKTEQPPVVKEYALV